MKYDMIVHETVVRKRFYTIEAKSRKEAREKALNGEAFDNTRWGDKKTIVHREILSESP